ncbi:MAG: PQQ-binding-like beta-propeller repeat protein [Acidobacteriota bacterium]
MHSTRSTMTRGGLVAALALAVAAAPVLASSPTFRGPDRDGLFAAEGLADSWSKAGPTKLWSISGVGEGYASLAIHDGRIFTTGKNGNQGFTQAFDLKGKSLWKTGTGEEHPGNGYPGSRSTPSTDGQHVYVMTSMGLAVALNAETGKIAWKVDTLKTFDGPNLYFGIAESPLLHGDHVIVTPGGKNASVVALHKKTGEVVWKSTGLSQKSAYCSARLEEIGGKEVLVTLLSDGIVGLDPANGKKLFGHELKVSYDIHAVSPLLAGDTLIVSHGYGQGTRGYKVTASSIKEIWHQKKLDVHHGGGILHNGHFYGAADKGTWYALKIEDGSIALEARRLGKGAIIYADGRLYGYNERGRVLLVDPADLSVKGEIKITEGEGQHWAHPVISDGVLYIRHGDAMMAFDAGAPSS